MQLTFQSGWSAMPWIPSTYELSTLRLTRFMCKRLHTWVNTHSPVDSNWDSSEKPCSPANRGKVKSLVRDFETSYRHLNTNGGTLFWPG